VPEAARVALSFMPWTKAMWSRLLWAAILSLSKEYRKQFALRVVGGLDEFRSLAKPDVSSSRHWTTPKLPPPPAHRRPFFAPILSMDALCLCYGTRGCPMNTPDRCYCLVIIDNLPTSSALTTSLIGREDLPIPRRIPSCLTSFSDPSLNPHPVRIVSGFHSRSRQNGVLATYSLFTWGQNGW